ncbi:MAG: divergent polysaccharide deacetylase family protein [Paracoccaceae bacterium]
MGRGYILGLLLGSAVVTASLAGVSLVIPFASPMPELGIAPQRVATTEEMVKADPAGAASDVAAPEPTEEPATEPEPAPKPEPAVEPEPTPETVPAAEPEPVDEPEPVVTAEAEAEPSETAAADLAADAIAAIDPEAQGPAVAEHGMQIALSTPESDADPAVPSGDTVPSAVTMPDVAAPEGASDPVPADATPALRPDAPDAPAALIVPGGVAESGVLPDAAPDVPTLPDESTRPQLPAIAQPDTAVPAEVTEPAPQPVVDTPAPEAVAESPADEPAAIETPAETAPEPVDAPRDEIIMAEAPQAEPEPAPLPETDGNDGMTPGEAASIVIPPSTSRLPQIVAEPDEQAPLPEVVPVEEQAPATTEPRIIALVPAPQPGFGKRVVPGVKVNRLPTVGTAADEPVDDASENRIIAIEPAPEASADPVPAVERYAAPFDNPEAKPLVAVLLIDDVNEAGSLDADALAAIGLPVTVAIDPEAPDAAARAATYRLAGLEIAILMPPVPSGATASDLEVSYQAVTGILPESVAVIGAPDAIYQSDRRVAQHLVALLATEGRGLITYGRGLNPAHQTAAGEGLPQAVVYRELDADAENAETIARYLDRAAFEAARIGAVVVVGHNAPDTVTALRDWSEAGAKGAVIGPTSAAMTP